jgi:hypothetical protein
MELRGKNISRHLTRALSEHTFIGSELESVISGRVAKHAIRCWMNSDYQKFWAYQYKNCGNFLQECCAKQ